jgi:hypothetical protein
VATVGADVGSFVLEALALKLDAAMSSSDVKYDLCFSSLRGLSASWFPRYVETARCCYRVGERFLHCFSHRLASAVMHFFGAAYNFQVRITLLIMCCQFGGIHFVRRQMVHCKLIYGLIRTLVAAFEDIHIELLLIILKGRGDLLSSSQLSLLSLILAF